MAQLLTGTRIYGTGTVDTQLFVSGTNSATSTTTGALQVVGGVGIGGNLYVGGTIFGASINGTASTATNAVNIASIATTTNAAYYPAFVDSNNATSSFERLYTTSSFIINPQSGYVGLGTLYPFAPLQIDGTATSNQQAIFNNYSANTSAKGFITLGNGGSPLDVGLYGYAHSTLANFGYINFTGGFLFQASGAELIRITNTGSVGVGTSTPISKFVVNGGTVNSTTYTTSEARIADGTLHLMKTSAGGVFEALRAINNDTTVGTTVRLLAAATSDPFNNANGGKVFIDAVRTASNMDLVFSLNDTGGAAAVERLRVLGSGAIAFNGSTNYGSAGQLLQSNGNAAPTWISTGSLTAASANTATHLAGGVAGQIPYQTAPGVTSFLSTGTAGNVLVSNGSSAPTYNNTLTLTGTTAATSTTTGALQVVGGFGLGGDLFIRGDIATNDTTFNLINATATTVNFAGAATSLNVGATSGSTNVRNNLTVSGNLTVQGTTTIVDSTVTNIADPIITLGGGAGNTNPTADDNKDRGIAFKWVNDGGTTSTGFFGYDDSTGFLTYVQTATITNEVVSGTKGAMDVNLAGGSSMAIVYQSSLNNTGFLAAGTSGYILQTNGTASPPTWVSASGVSAGSATNADNIRTIAQTSNAVYYPTFVDSNNASNAYESVYTTGTFVINPATGYIGMGTASPNRPLHVVAIGTGTQGIAAFEAKASGFVVQDNGSQNGNVELVGYKQTSSTYHNILLRGSGPGLLIQTGTGNIGIEDTAPGTKLTVLGAGGSTLGTNGYLVHIGGTDSSVDPVRYMIGFSHGNNSTSTNVRAAIGGMITTGGAGNLIFETGSSGSQVERMRITGSGGISFGTGGANYGSSGQLLQSNGNAAPTWVNQSGITSGATSLTNTYVGYGSASNLLTGSSSLTWNGTTLSINGNINAATGQLASFNAQAIGQLGSPNQGTYAGYLLLAKAYVSGLQASSFVEGEFVVKRGGTSSGNRTDRYIISSCSGYNSEGFVVQITSGSGVGDGFFVSTVKVTYSGTVYHAIKTTVSGGIPDNGVMFFGSSYNAGMLYVDATYVSSESSFGNYTFLNSAGNQGFGTNVAPGSNGKGVSIYASDYPRLSFRNSTTGDTTGDGTQLLMSGADFYLQNQETGALIFNTASTERLRITSNGGIAFGGSSNYGTSGQILKSNGDAAPTWVNQSSITSGATSLTNTYVGYGSASNLLTGSSNFTWDGTKLLVSGTSISPYIKVSGTGGTYSYIQLDDASSNGYLIKNVSAGTGNGALAGALYTYTDNSKAFQHIHSGTPLFTILSTGNVGIGSTAPKTKLQSSGAAQTTSPTLGSITGAGLYLTNTDEAYGLLAGVASNGNAWLQVQRTDATATAYNLNLQPSGGNVGIGTTSPNRKLHVQSSGAAIQLFDASSNGGTGIFFAGASTLKNWFIGNQYNVSDVLEFTPSAAVGTTTIGSTPAVTMQSGGNVGIGVNSPEYLLDLGTLAEEYTTDKIRFNSYNGPAGGVSGYGGTGGSGTSLGSGIIWKPNYSGYSKRSAGILQIGEGNYFRSGLAFYTNNVTDGSTDWSEAMRIGSNGNVSIGAGSNPSLLNKFEVSGTAGQLFSVSDSTSGTIFAVSDVSGIPSVEVLDTGLVKLAQYNGQVAIGTGTVASSTATVSIYGMLYTMGTLGEIRASSEITAYFSSDARLKENIKLIENPITIIDQIRGVTFDWTEEHMARRGGEDGYFVRKHDIGVIAQEVQAVLPELVGTREDGYLAVKYEKMVPLLIEAIKEQQKTIDKQQESINNLILELANIKDTLASVNKN